MSLSVSQDIGTLSLLAIDDDPIYLEFCSVYLATPNVIVATADSAETGLAALQAKDFDVALVDVDMPGMNGIDLVKRLRADARYDDLPIMIVTGREDIVSIDQAYAAGATAFMCKPVNWRLLSHQVKFLVRAFRAMSRAERLHN